MKKEAVFLLTRGLGLCVLLLFLALALTIRAGEGGTLAVTLLDYADQLQLAALIAFGGGMIGSLVLEDILRYYEG